MADNDCPACSGKGNVPVLREPGRPFRTDRRDQAYQMREVRRDREAKTLTTASPGNVLAGWLPPSRLYVAGLLDSCSTTVIVCHPADC